MRLFSVFLLLFALEFTLMAKPEKMYETESGIVEYEIRGGGTLMGMKTSTKGTKTLSFKNWGNLSLTEETKTVETNGKAKQERTLGKFENGIVYVVDFEQKAIMKMDMQDSMNAYGKGKSNMTQVGREMMQQMGGKKVGEESVLGYTCEVWEFQWGKVWGHKGIPLKTQSTMMGITHTEIATKVNFGASIPSSKFVLPNYPIQSMDDMIMQNMQKGEGMEDMSDAEKKELKELMKNMGSMFGK